MQYIKLSSDKFIQYDETNDTSRVIVKSELESQLTEAKARLAEIPPASTDKELLEWAKANYPFMDYSNEKQSLEQIISEGEATLASMK